MLLSLTMKPIVPATLIALLILAAFGSVFTQQGPPPPPAPDYNPKSWKEYSFAEDNVRFRFPVRPKRVETTSGSAKHPASEYIRESFMYFGLSITKFPAGWDKGAIRNSLLDGGVTGMLNGIKNLEP